MRVLFTSPILEHPAAGGPQLRIENSIKALSRVAELDVISRSPLCVTGGEQALEFYRGFTSELHIAPSAIGLPENRYLRKMQRLIRGLAGRDVDADAVFIVEHARRRAIRTVWFGYGNISFPLIRRIKSMDPGIRAVCDTDSVWSRFITREMPYANGLRKWQIARAGRAKELEEQAWTDMCEATTAVSEIDAAYYRRVTRSPERVHVFSNVIDLEAYSTLPPPPSNFKKPCVYLAGTFGRYHSPMDHAARWIISDVLPILQKAVPGLHFYIVGTGSERTLGHLGNDNITITGKLPTVLPYLCHADVALVPLKFESGTRFKILEAGACGIPIVSTTLGAEGIPVSSGKELLLADDPAEFAAAVIRLIKDKAYARQIADRCKAMVQRHYSVDTLVSQAKPILEGLSND